MTIAGGQCGGCLLGHYVRKVKWMQDGVSKDGQAWDAMRGRLVVLHLLVERGNVIEVVAGNDFTQSDVKFPKLTRIVR